MELDIGGDECSRKLCVSGCARATAANVIGDVMDLCGHVSVGEKRRGRTHGPFHNSCQRQWDR